MRMEAAMRMEATRSNRWRGRDRTDGGDAIEPIEATRSNQNHHQRSGIGHGGSHIWFATVDGGSSRRGEAGGGGDGAGRWWRRRWAVAATALGGGGDGAGRWR
ncbi:hypothetical protein U1Q18_048733 [Sarracenia purpurea var. burkii]